MPLFSLWHLNWVFLWLRLNVFRVLESKENFSLGLKREGAVNKVCEQLSQHLRTQVKKPNWSCTLPWRSRERS